MIKRYRHWLGEEARHMVETFDGEYVLYTDHIAETRKLIDTYDLLISQEDKKIAELEAENKRLREELEFEIKQFIYCPACGEQSYTPLPVILPGQYDWKCPKCGERFRIDIGFYEKEDGDGGKERIV